MTGAKRRKSKRGQDAAATAPRPLVADQPCKADQAQTYPAPLTLRNVVNDDGHHQGLEVAR